jgi:hypothetical protein
MRIVRDPYFADIIKDARPGSEIWHWIIQCTGSSEILAWSHASTEEKAVSAATERLDSLTAKRASSSSAAC